MACILITGAAGSIATALRPRLLADGHFTVLVDVVELREPPRPGEEFHLGSILDGDLLTALVRGVDAVLHLGGYPSERPWSEIAETNIGGTQSVLEAAAVAGVERVLLASSIHAVGFTPVAEAADSPVLPPRPDSYYGVGKVALEALGCAFADRAPMLVVAVRIANFAARPTDRRGLSFWCSPGDLHRLVTATLETDERGFHLVWGVSANTRTRIDPSAAQAIGFEPIDDAECFAAEVLAATGAPDEPLDGLLGASFAAPDTVLGVRRR